MKKHKTTKAEKAEAIRAEKAAALRNELRKSAAARAEQAAVAEKAIPAAMRVLGEIEQRFRTALVLELLLTIEQNDYHPILSRASFEACEAALLRYAAAVDSKAAAREAGAR